VQPFFIETESVMPTLEQTQSDKSKELERLRSRLTAAEQLYVENVRRYERLMKEAHDKYDEFAAAKPRSKRKEKLKKEHGELIAKAKTAQKAFGKMHDLMKSLEQQISDLENDVSAPDESNAENSVKPVVQDLAVKRYPTPGKPRAAIEQKADPLDRSRFSVSAVKQKLGAMLGRQVASDGSMPPKKPVPPILPPHGDDVWPGIEPEIGIGEPIHTSPGFPMPDDGVVAPIDIPEIDHHTTNELDTANDPVAAEPWLAPDDLDDEDTFGLPVLLDLDGDGIEIISLGQSRARFDMAGTGRKQIMAWPGPNDALFVYDRDGDRLISHRDEIAFANYLANAKTDLEGLAWFDMAARGGNEDGVLNALDALWSKFGVWQDTNQDGETDPGELTMTGEGGLSSVNLQSDHIPRDAGPDARIHGQGEYQTTDADGRVRSGDLYDASLRYEQSPEPKSAAEIFYPRKPVKLTPEQQGYRRVRKDGQPLSKAEIFYPDESRAHEYTYVRIEPDEAVIQQQKNADLLYDHPTSNPKK